jgi:general secretion pathway protein G
MGNSKRAGFTLIELLVVIGIIVLLAGIVMPNFMKYMDKAKIVRARADIHSIENALAMYQTDWGVYPGQGEDPDLSSDSGDGQISNLEEIFQTDGTNGRGPYLSKNIPNDPYGTKYRYIFPGSSNPLTTRSYDLWSYGKDKADGGDPNDDIACWDTETS